MITEIEGNLATPEANRPVVRPLTLHAVAIDIPDAPVEEENELSEPQSALCKKNFINLTALGMSVGPLVYYTTERADFAAGAVSLIALGFYIGCKCPKKAKDFPKVFLKDSADNIRILAQVTSKTGKQGLRVTRVAIGSLNMRNLRRIGTMARCMTHSITFMFKSLFNQQCFSCLFQSGQLAASITCNGARLIKATGNAVRQIPEDVVQISNHFAEGMGAMVSGAAKVGSIAIKVPASLASAPFTAVHRASYKFPIITGYIVMAMVFYVAVLSCFSAQPE